MVAAALHKSSQGGQEKYRAVVRCVEQVEGGSKTGVNTDTIFVHDHKTKTFDS